jgi:hypothetical protein
MILATNPSFFRCECHNYAEITSSDDDNTTYDTQTHVGSHVQLAPILDHMVSFLSICSRFSHRMFLLLPHIYALF